MIAARFWVICLMLICGACSFPPAVGPPPSPVVIQEQATISSRLTDIVSTANEGDLRLTQAPLLRQTAPVQATRPVRTEELQSTGLATVGMCDRALAGVPLDVTIPDGTRLRPRQHFTKVWRLVNAGACAWTRDYSLAWFSGETMTPLLSFHLSGTVYPGRAIDLSLDLVAPEQPGIFQGNWKLKNPSGAYFGIGPAADAPIWVKIEVIESATPTPIQAATATTARLIAARGLVNLLLNEGVDLDNSQLNNGIGDDLAFQKNSESNPVLLPRNGTRIGIFGLSQPLAAECQRMTLSSGPILFRTIVEGTYLCYRSSQGLVGFLVLNILKDNGISLEFVTWIAP